MFDVIGSLHEDSPIREATGSVPGVVPGAALSGSPDLLSHLQAIIAADVRPPGFSGRQAIGLFDGRTIRWLLLHFKGNEVRGERSDERLAPWGFDCTWILPVEGGEASALPEPTLPSLVDGDPSLIDRIRRRYLQTRRHLGPRMESYMERLFKVSCRPSMTEQILDLWLLRDPNLAIGMKKLAVDLVLRGTMFDPKYR